MLGATTPTVSFRPIYGLRLLTENRPVLSHAAWCLHNAVLQYILHNALFFRDRGARRVGKMGTCMALTILALTYVYVARAVLHLADATVADAACE